MKSIKVFMSQYKHFYMLLLLLPLLAWFKYCEAVLVPKYIMHSTLDDKIPFIKEFVIPYIIWFFYVAYGVVYTGIHSKQDYYKLYIFLAGGLSVCYALYMLFPNAQDLRPVVNGNNPFSNLVKFIYRADTPTNVCPSIHVFNTIAVDAALKNSSSFRTKKYGMAISSTLAVLICLSTLFIKQHSIIDAIAGTILALIFYIPIYGVSNVGQLVGITRNKELLKATNDN